MAEDLGDVGTHKAIHHRLCGLAHYRELNTRVRVSLMDAAPENRHAPFLHVLLLGPEQVNVQVVLVIGQISNNALLGVGLLDMNLFLPLR